MNVTELARILKITPQELHTYLPQLGFDIGFKAIKINYDIANKIIRDWPNLKKQLERQKLLAQSKTEILPKEEQPKKTLAIPSLITVRELSTLSGLPVSAILAELMKNGVFASLNERVDFDTAWLVGSELGLDLKLKVETSEPAADEQDKLKKILAGEQKKDLLPRPPVIVVMGHVDHGKTKLLDAIRKTDVVAGEAGGITQHIGAYQVTRKDKVVTFIDTPGHEAFTAMRSRGAKVADIAILVVAADDGVKPQTIEAFRIIEAVGVSYVVAINKIDKPEANLDKTKQELSSQLNIIPEDWGGKTICVPVSAKAGTGISDLLDMVLLVAETQDETIRANPNAAAVGTVIESRLDKGSGPIATILIQNGTMRVGDLLNINGLNIGKVRNLYNYLGKSIALAPPSTPVRVIGLKTMPQVGDIVEVGEGERVNIRKIRSVAAGLPPLNAEAEKEDENKKKINLLIKADVLGSAEAIEESLAKIDQAKVKIRIIHKGLGNIAEGDIKRAEEAHAAIAGFNIKVPPVMAELAREKNVEIKTYKIIYDLINDIKSKMKTVIGIELKRLEIGRLKVIASFRTEKNYQIIGGQVTSGQIELNAIAAILRDQITVSEGKISKLQIGKQDVKLVAAGEECGLQIDGKPAIVKGDQIIVYKEVELETKI